MKHFFRRFNLFDYLVIVSLVLVFAIFLGLRYAKKTEWVSVKVRVSNDEWWWEGQPPDFWYVDSLKPQQASYNSFGEKVAEITNVEIFDIGGTKRRATIDMKLKVTYDKGKGQYFFNFQPLQTGKPLDLTFEKNNVRGLVTYIDSPNTQYKMKKIEVKIFAARPWVAESYKKGMQMLDSNGKVLAEIEDVSTQPSQDYEFYDARGRRFVVPGVDNSHEDVTFVMNILVYSSDNVDYFIDGSAVKLGEVIWFHFPQTLIRDAEVSKIFN